LAMILAKALINKFGMLEDYFEKFENKDEMFFMEEIIQKYHNYTKDEAALKYVKPKTDTQA
jgi:hypothetical protein